MDAILPPAPGKRFHMIGYLFTFLLVVVGVLIVLYFTDTLGVKALVDKYLFSGNTTGNTTGQSTTASAGDTESTGNTCDIDCFARICQSETLAYGDDPDDMEKFNTLQDCVCSKCSECVANGEIGPDDGINCTNDNNNGVATETEMETEM